MKDQKKTNPFKTPEGYFEGLKDTLKDRLSEESTVLPEKDGLAVPEDYFDSLKEKILGKLEAQETKVIALNPYKKYYYAAASIAAVLLVAYVLNLGISDNATFEDLASSDIESYFEENEFGLSSYEIAEVLPLDELEIGDILEENLNEDQVIDYLDETIDDFEDLNLDNDE